MKIGRREFLTTTAGAALYASASVLFAAPDCPNPNDPNDPNAITDPDHEIGKPYVGWREGDFDVHFIYTGGGENCFHIFPDGTTCLVDCGDLDVKGTRGARACELAPDESRQPGEWVARYIGRLLPKLDKIDYVVASHFHSDHIGSGAHGAGITCGRTPDYQLSGIAQVGDFYNFGTAFDRGYPSYDRPTEWAPGDRDNLLRFFTFKEQTAGLNREEFVVGALDQIKSVHAPEKYDFHVRNVCKNGVLWLGKDGETLDYFETWPENKTKNKNENTRSIVTVTQYGDFRLYSGGDASGVLLDESGADLDFEGAIGRVVGPVDVCKTNHHSFSDAMRPSFVNAVRARAYVTCVWCEGHLRENTAAAMADDSASGYPGPRLICPNGTHPDWAKAAEGKPWRNKLVERVGHVVVKAYDGGKKYKIYYLTAKDESMTVDLVFGPFDAGANRRA